jgi:hypothetical protein
MFTREMRTHSCKYAPSDGNIHKYIPRAFKYTLYSSRFSCYMEQWTKFEFRCMVIMTSNPYVYTKSIQRRNILFLFPEKSFVLAKKVGGEIKRQCIWIFIVLLTWLQLYVHLTLSYYYHHHYHRHIRCHYRHYYYHHYGLSSWLLTATIIFVGRFASFICILVLMDWNFSQMF